MHIEEITTKDAWAPASPSFLQSWEWGEFQRAAGYEPLRLQVEGECVQGFVHRLPLGQQFGYFPRVGISTLQSLISYANTTALLFLRIEPQHQVSGTHFPRTRCRQPQHTLILDLTKPEETLLAEMHSKTRYNIRLAEKKGVEVRPGKNIDWFWSLNEATTARDGFQSHNKAYYAQMLELPIVHQLTAFVDDIPIASQIYIGSNGTCTYLHGASSDTHRNLMAPYLLQWRSLQIAKQYGNTRYDMWGVAPPQHDGMHFHTYRWDPAHPLSRVTRYKAGFGGSLEAYPDAYEVPLQRTKYRIFQLAKKVL